MIFFIYCLTAANMISSLMFIVFLINYGTSIKTYTLQPGDIYYREVEYNTTKVDGIYKGHFTYFHDYLPEFIELCTPDNTSSTCDLQVSPSLLLFNLQTAIYTSHGPFHNIKCGNYYSRIPPRPLIINTQVVLRDWCLRTLVNIHTSYCKDFNYGVFYNDTVERCKLNPLCTAIVLVTSSRSATMPNYYMGYGKPFRCIDRMVVWTSREHVDSWEFK
jgi:hypothetical protein